MNTIHSEKNIISSLYAASSIVLFLPRAILFVTALFIYFWLALGTALLISREILDKHAGKKVLRVACRTVLAILEIHVVDDSEAHSRIAKGSIILANHVSYLDILVLGSHFETTFVCKEEVRSWPVFGLIAQSIGCVFVNRKSLQSRVRVLREITRRIHNNENIALFPEGTTTYFGVPSRQRWNTGHIHSAMSANRPIVLSAITYDDQESAAWWGKTALLPHIFKQFLHGPRDVLLKTEIWGSAPGATPREISFRIHHRICSMCLTNQHRMTQRHLEGRYVYS